ncbi:MAG: hypothetical protein AB7I50_03105, partial [Vicinamibacterales bacterium]
AALQMGVWGQASPSKTRDPLYREFDRILELVRALYPDLVGRGYGAALELRELVDGPPTAAAEVGLGFFSRVPDGHFMRYDERKFSVALLFNPDGSLSSLRAGSSYTREEDQARLMLETKDHPDWTDQDVVRACRDRGGQYCQDEAEGIRALIQDRVRRLSTAFGPARLVSVTGPDSIRRDSPGGDVWVRWQALIEFSSGPFHQLNLVFEPFEGKVIRVFHYPLPSR